MELLLGCGSRRERMLGKPGQTGWTGLVTLDREARHKPDIVFDLNNTTLPFPDNHFDELHAYEVLEHLGSQGDELFFFAQWGDFWRVLKPGGYFFGTVPTPKSIWAYGDPSHKRIIPKECFIFLSQEQYATQVGSTPMSDFRSLWHGDFEMRFQKETEQIFAFGLEAIKPARHNGGRDVPA